MMRPVSTVTVVLVLMSAYVAQAAILRPEWFPYFREELQGQGLQNVMDYLKGGSTIAVRQLRDNGNVNCPPDMPEYECHHELMAVWTRLMNKKQKRSAPGHLLEEPTLDSRGMPPGQQ